MALAIDLDFYHKGLGLLGLQLADGLIDRLPLGFGHVVGF